MRVSAALRWRRHRVHHLITIAALLVSRLVATPAARSTAWQISTNFPGGSALVHEVAPETGRILISPNCPPERGWAAWWYFRLDGVTPGTVVTLEVNGRGFALPDRAQVSSDDRQWTHTDAGERRPGSIVYHHRVTSSPVWFAWGPPFGLRDANELAGTLSSKHPFVESFELARSRDGRPVPAVHVKARVDGAPVVWIQARQHAWESGGSWACRGFLEWWLSAAPAATVLREHVDLYAVPVMDVDSVERGFGGKNQKPHDHEWDWSATPIFPEVHAAMTTLAAFEKERRLAAYIDLHDPNLNDHELMFYVAARPLLTPARLRPQEEFFRFVRDETAGPGGFVGKLGPIGDTYTPAVDTTSECWIASHCRPEVISVVAEIPWNVPAGTPEGYARVGAQLARAVQRFLAER